jgi:hypothetical protein
MQAIELILERKVINRKDTTDHRRQPAARKPPMTINDYKRKGCRPGGTMVEHALQAVAKADFKPCGYWRSRCSLRKPAEGQIPAQGMNILSRALTGNPWDGTNPNTPVSTA